jgi:hypothetical protein
MIAKAIGRRIRLRRYRPIFVTPTMRQTVWGSVIALLLIALQGAMSGLERNAELAIEASRREADALTLAQKERREAQWQQILREIKQKEFENCLRGGSLGITYKGVRAFDHRCKVVEREITQWGKR